MEDTDFFDTLYQGWAKTTGGENTFWMQEEEPEVLGPTPMPGFEGDLTFDAWPIFAVDSEQNKRLIGLTLMEEDAAWITALHGCFGDLVRRLHTAVDEAERFNRERDDQEVAIAEVELERQEAVEKLESLETVMRKMDQDLIKANADAIYWEAEARGRGEG